MKNSSKVVCIGSMLALLALTHVGFAASSQNGAKEHLFAVDSDAKQKQLEIVLSVDNNGDRPHNHKEMLIRLEQMMRGQISANSPTHAAELAEERIGFLKSELEITDKQIQDWNALAEALRSGRQHLTDARKLAVLADKTPSSERLEHYERHLVERLEAVKSARAAFMQLYRTLDDVQKQTADEILVPLIATF